MRVLLTGGLGYVGSHTAVALLAAGFEPIILDNLSNCSRSVIDDLAKVAGQPLVVVEHDVRDRDAVQSVLISQKIDAVIHLAANKAVAESVARPLQYFSNNVGGMLSLLEAMDACDIRSIVFSSSATVYGNPTRVPIVETDSMSAANPYGRTKLICESILTDLAAAGLGWRVSLLRYFNPVGAHPSGLIGENPKGIPNNLMPLLIRAALGQSAGLNVYGSDYPTRDGTAVRDYVHVMDLAEGHVAALKSLGRGNAMQVYNLGTGTGTTVLEFLETFERATGVRVPYSITHRRPGDVAELFASVEKAEREMGWRASRDLLEMCADSWRHATQVTQRLK